MAKKTNKFDAPSEGVKAGAPGDETPVVISEGNPKPVKFKKNGDPFKVRGPSGPRTVNPKIEAFKKTQKDALEAFVTDQKGKRCFFMRDLRVESDAAKLQARMEKTCQRLSPVQLGWLDKQAEKRLAEKAAKANALHPDPVPEEQQNDQP